MKYYLISTILLLGFNAGMMKSEDFSKKDESLKTEVSNIKNKQELLQIEFKVLFSKEDKTARKISDIQSANKKMSSTIDSIRNAYNTLVANQKTDKSELVNSIDKTNELVRTTKDVLFLRTLWGIIIVLVFLIMIVGVAYRLTNRIRSGKSSIDDVRKAQETLQSAQLKMQEESVKLDDKLLELFDRQMSNSPKMVDDGKPDHSLALKVADEIVRIELNMSRMDSSIKGYKQLAKAVGRIKDNFKANGYEIVDMLGKPYNEGMKVTANFVSDEDLEEGKQIITGITKPQINYNGQMIQAAQITVSQNI